MKYTRYDYKKKKNDSLTLIIVLVSVLIVAFLLGTGIFTMVTKQPNKNDQTTVPMSTSTPKNKEGEPVVEQNTSVKLVAIQSGFFKKKDNAEDLKNRLKEHVIPFTIVEGENIRIMAGIFTEEESVKVIQLLNEKQIPNTKTVFEISKADVCDAEIAEMINGNIKILSKVIEKDVTAVETDDFKNWITTNLKAADPKSKNYSLLEELKGYLNGLPKEFGKEKVEENYVFLYNILKKVTAK